MSDEQGGTQERFERDGFVHGGRILEPGEVALLAEEMERYIDDGFRGRPTGVPQPIYRIDLGGGGTDHLYQIGNLWEVSDPFRKLVHDRRLVEAAVRATGALRLQVWVDQVMYKPERRGAHFGWHQDGAYHLSVEPADRLFAAWIAFDDADEESGCMWMAPGSHRWGLREHQLLRHRHLAELTDFASLPGPAIAAEFAGEWRGVLPCPVKAGEVHFHHAHTWHGSPTNRSGRRRRGYAIHFMREDVRCATDQDVRIPLRPGMSMADAGPGFPTVYPFPA
jgi:ectoine hydroxylase-related dioxygenase (phytanoyl-CoA dioxygenase family)